MGKKLNFPSLVYPSKEENMGGKIKNHLRSSKHILYHMGPEPNARWSFQESF